jgi:hypothetical protein
MDTLRKDLIFAIRSLRRQPGFALVTILTLALGIGANTAIFSLLDAVMLKSLPVQNPDSLVLFGNGRIAGLSDSFPSGSSDIFTYSFYREAQPRPWPGKCGAQLPSGALVGRCPAWWIRGLLGR